MVKQCLQVMPFLFVCVLFFISSSSTAPKGETNGFWGNVSIEKSSTGAVFLLHRGEEGEEQRVQGFLSFRFLRRSNPS